MKIKSVISETLQSTDLRDPKAIEQYLSQMDIPLNIFSHEYRKARELELELIKYVQILELLEKYNEDIKWRQIELHYFRDSTDTVIVVNLEFTKRKKQKQFEKELEEIKHISKKELRKMCKKK